MKDLNIHIDFLDYFRAAAILAVFAFHCMGTAFGFDQLPWSTLFPDFAAVKPLYLLLTPLTYGWAGVAIFFAVSGFCIHLSYIRNPQQGWYTFFVRRFWRIYPPYLVALVILALILPIIAVPLVQPFNRLQFFSHLLLIHNLHRTSLFGINPALWSIAVEMQLYLLYPLLLRVVSRWGWQHTLLLLGSVEIALRLWQGINLTLTNTELATFITQSPFIYWYSWSTGAWLADAYVKDEELPFTKTRIWIWLTLALLAYLIKPFAKLSFPFFALFTTTWIAKLLRTPNPNHAVSPYLAQTLQFIGVISYSFYLLHQPFLQIFSRLLLRLLPALQLHHSVVFVLCLLTMALIVPISGLFYRYVEMPSITIGKWFAKRYPVPKVRSPATSS